LSIPSRCPQIPEVSTILLWIIASCVGMSLIALVGLVTLALNEEQLDKVLLPLVALSAGSLLAGSILHLIPEVVARRGAQLDVFLWVLVGFALFFLMEQFLNWHHHHAVPSRHKKPVTYLILVADGLHNFIGGLAIASSFLVSVEVGIVTWIAAAAHEVPQELGDFGILVHGGWKRPRALVLNLFSALMIVPGGLLAYFVAAGGIDTTFLLSFAAGNFIYISASDLIPEVKHETRLATNMIHFGAFVCGILLIWLTRLVFEI
jgi:zinc and cadmium transporter